MAYKNRETANIKRKEWIIKNPDYFKNYRKKNREKILEYRRDYRIRNHEKILKQEEEWREKNRDKLRKSSMKFEKSEGRKRWREENRTIMKGKARKRYLSKRDENIKKRKEYVLKNHEKVRECLRKNYQSHKEDRYKYSKDKKKNNPNFLIRCRLSTNLWTAIKKYSDTGKIWKARVYGVDYNAIIKHLKPFPKDISKYHIDHIRPLCSFDLTEPEQVKEAFAPENHQWLTVKENLSKGGRY